MSGTDGTLPGDWSGLVMVAAATPWHGPRLLDQHLATQLTRYAPVLYVDPPRPWRPDRRRRPDPTLRLVAPRLAHLTPHVLPAHQRPGVKATTLALVRRAMRAASAQLGSPPVRCVIVLSLNRLFGACDEQLRVLYLADDLVAGADLIRVSRHRLARAQRRREAEADLIVAASPALADAVRAGGREATLVPNGCDVDVFAATDHAPPPPDLALDAPAAGVMGHLTARIDVRYLEALAAEGLPLLLVGPAPRGLTPELEALVRRPGVHWTGPRPYAELPSYLRQMAVGLVPYADTPFNRASFPLKALEYLAAGRPVVSTDIGGLRWLRDGARGLAPDDLVIVRTPAELAARAAELLAGGLDDEGIARRRAFAAEHSWERRAAVLAGALGLRPPPPTSHQ